MFGGNKSVKVPDCKGLKVSACEAKLEKAGLSVSSNIKTKASDSVKKNRVIKTDPASGKSIKKGTEVTIYKSSGKSTIELEDYTGQNSIEVKTVLETKYGLVVTIEKKDVSSDGKDHEDDEIVGQSLAAGSKVKKGDTLVLYVPEDAEVYADMVTEGWDKSQVEDLCNDYNLNCTFTPEETNSYKEGVIIRQSRRVGSTISRGSSLTVYYAVKPKKTTTSPSPSASSSTSPSPSGTPSTGSGDSNS